MATTPNPNNFVRILAPLQVGSDMSAIQRSDGADALSLHDITDALKYTPFDAANIASVNPTVGQALVFNGTKWINQDITRGTVTRVAATGSNGVTVTGSPITSTGTIDISLGDITPTSVAATGTVTASSVNGITGLSSSVPSALGAASEGTATTAARADHVHALPVYTLSSLSDTTIATPVVGQTLTYNGTSWVNQTPTTVSVPVKQTVIGAIPAVSGTTVVPLDNTAPTATEGFQIWTQAFTPQSATSKIIIEFNITTSHSVATGTNILSVFAGTTNIGSSAVRVAVANAAYQISMSVLHSPGAVTPITLSARLGGSATGTAYCNLIGATTLGGSLVSEFKITEVA